MHEFFLSSLNFKSLFSSPYFLKRFCQNSLAMKNKFFKLKIDNCNIINSLGMKTNLLKFRTKGEIHTKSRDKNNILAKKKKNLYVIRTALGVLEFNSITEHRMVLVQWQVPSTISKRSQIRVWELASPNKIGGKVAYHDLF